MDLITIDKVTTIDLNGTGSFDMITAAFSKRLEEQWSESRIRGTEYANVYLGLMETALQQSMAFELGKLQACAQAELLAAQKDKVVAETGLLAKEGLKLDAEIALLTLQYTALERSIVKTDAETILINKNADNAVLQGLILVEDRLKTIAEKLSIDQNTANAVLTATLIIRNQDKTEAETQLLRTKKFTEEAQFKDSADGADVTGIIGKQKSLYAAQTAGFARDAEQKLAKIMADTWTTRRSTDEAENPAGTGLTNVEISAVMAKARAGIGI